MKLVPLLVLLFTTLVAHAQTRGFNSVHAGVDYMSLDAPDGTGYRYVADYSRHVANDRFVIRLTGGYLTAANPQRVYQQTFLQGLPRKRFTADLTALYDLLRSPRHALRLGGGPSLWYREDELLLEATFNVGLGGTVTNINAIKRLVKETNLGYHVTAEYEFRFSPELSVRPRFMLANLGPAGFSSVAGVAVGYNF